MAQTTTRIPKQSQKSQEAPRIPQRSRKIPKDPERTQRILEIDQHRSLKYPKSIPPRISKEQHQSRKYDRIRSNASSGHVLLKSHLIGAWPFPALFPTILHFNDLVFNDAVDVSDAGRNKNATNATDTKISATVPHFRIADVRMHIQTFYISILLPDLRSAIWRIDLMVTFQLIRKCW